MLLLGVTIILEHLHMLLVFFFLSAARLCPMVPDLTMLFPMFYGHGL
jgi:hypothetical protein